MKYFNISRLPFHPRPYPDETISIYILRLADKNLTTPFCILQLAECLYPESSAQIRYNINTNVSPDSFRLLSTLTGFDEESFRKTTILRYNSVILQDENADSLWHISNNFWFNATRIKICPYCLKEKSYYRIHWKLQPVYACMEHRVLLVDTCQHCGQPIHDINPGSRTIYTLGECGKCGADFRKFTTISLQNDPAGLKIQKKITDILGNSSNIRIAKGLYISPTEFFNAMKTLYRMVSKLSPASRVLNRTDISQEIFAKTSHLFNVKKFYTFEGQPATKIQDVCFNYIVFSVVMNILNDWPDGFFSLLDELHRQYSPSKNDRKTRVFGLLQKVHESLKNGSSRLLYDSYAKWIRLRFDGDEHLRKVRYTDYRVYPYSVQSHHDQVNTSKLSANFIDAYWEKVKGLFHFPPNNVGSGNLRRRSEKRAKLFIETYLYKLMNNCPWEKTPTVKKKLIKPHGLYQRISLLRKQGRLEKITEKLLEIIVHMQKNSDKHF